MNKAKHGWAAVRRAGALALLLGGLVASAQAAAEIWVAPDGNDTATGSREQPLATIARALRKARELRRVADASVADGVKIVVRGGEYALVEPLFVRPEDSGTERSPTSIEAAPGERPVVSGGVAVAGWQELPAATELPGLPAAARGHVWVASVPDFNGRALEFRQLWVDGKKAVRARTPDGDEMTRLVSWDRPKREAWIPASTTVPKNLRGVEMTILQMWEIAIVRLKSHRIEGDRARVTFHDPEARVEFEHPWPQPVFSKEYGASPFFLSNAIEFLDTPGEWYEDLAAGKIYYWPREGENLAKVRVVAPALETLVRVTGSLDRPVAQVSFSGIEFSDTTWLRPSLAGHVPLQAGMYMLDAYGLRPPGTPDWRGLDNQEWLGRPPAAVEVTAAQHVAFRRCRFVHTAADGLDLVSGVHDAVVEGCVFHDIGINGLLVGTLAGGGIEAHLPYKPQDEREICQRGRIANNLFTDTANEDWGGVALLAGFVRDTTIEHNEIDGTSYTGISVGWGWTRTANAMRRNTIRANLMRRVATRLSDTAGVYTLSAQPGTVVSENVVLPITMSRWVHDPEHWFYYYCDEGSAFITVRDNWCPAEKFLKNANGPGVVFENNGPQVDEKIKAAAGLEAAYQDLRTGK